MKGKIIVPLLLASVGAGVVATTRQQHTAYADQIYASDIDNVVGDLVEITNYKSNGTLGGNVYLPNATAFDESDNPTGVALTAKVVDPSGRVLTEGEILTDGQGKYFVPKLKGYYSVSFATVSDDIKTETNALKIYVAGEDYSISLPTNSKYVIPTTIPVSTKPLLIPAPKVLLDGEEVKDAIKTGSEGLKVSVVNKNSSNNPVELAAPTKDADGNYYYSFVPSTAGVYEIVYKYISGTVQDYKTQRFVVKDGYDTSKMVLNFSYASSRPTSAILGKETTLPKINIVNKTTGQTIEGYAHIVVEHMETGTFFKVDENYTFTPTLKGKYRISYTAKLDYFGLTSNTHTFVIEDVKDTVAPVARAVNRYETDANGEITFVYDSEDNVIFKASDYTDEEELEEELEKALSNLNYAIPSVVALTPNGSGKNEATITIPAIYGTDNFDELSGLTFKRSIRASSTGVVTDFVGEHNKPVSQVIGSAGNYTIRYIVTDKAGNEKMTSFDIKVVDNVNTLKKDDVFLQPTITMQALSAYIKADATVVFNAPTASDTYDTRVEVNTYYNFDTIGSTKEKITQTNASGQLVLDLSEIEVPSNAKELIITVEAINDYSGVPTTITRVVKLINTSDNDVPTFIDEDQFLVKLTKANGLNSTGTIDSDGYLYSNEAGDEFLGEPFVQKQTIVLPELTLSDLSDPNLEVNVTVRDPFGKVTTLLNSEYSSVIAANNNQFTIKNGKFVANYSGIYTVTYTAKDAGGNIVLKTFGIRVKDTEKPTIMLSSFDPFMEEMEVGKFIEVPAANLKDNGVIVDDLTYGYKEADKAGISWRLENSSNATVVNGIGFTPLAAGEYVVIYEGWDAADNKTESRSYTVVVKDSLKPTIVLENDLYLSSGVEFVENEEITIPGVIELYDGYRDSINPSNNYDQTAVSDITLTVKVKDSNGNNITVSSVNEQTAGGVEITRYKFIPTGHGVYTIDYSAIDSTGNTTQITKTLEVGDVNAPDLVWADDYSIITTAKLGDTFELNMGKATISDDEDVLDDIDKVIYMYAPDDTIVDNLVTNGYKWEFDTVGTYTLKITLTDSANNKETYSYSITVAEEEVEEETIAPWLGTTLIVATAVILAGVVVYFVVTSKNGKATTTKRRTTKK